MDDFNYAPTNQTLTYDDPGHVRTMDPMDAPGNPYNVDEYYYAHLILKEWQACPSEVALLYFSVKNIKRIQKLIRRDVYNRSLKKFKLSEDQNVIDLLTAMRAVYKLYAKDIPTKITRQVKILNKETIEYIVPDMMTNLKQHYGYLDDIKNPINPLPVPINVNQAGRNQLTGVAQIYGI
jgi:hypothetical protein